jgi:hypothetical protein
VYDAHVIILHGEMRDSTTQIQVRFRMKISDLQMPFVFEHDVLSIAFNLPNRLAEHH